MSFRTRLALCAATPLLALMLAIPAGPAHAGYEDLAGDVQEIVLDNGLKILLLERHDVPVFSFWTYVGVGGVDEEVGKSGLAHMFEHMAFKGTLELGSLDIKRELKALDALEEAYAQLQSERLKGDAADAARLATLESRFDALEAEADGLVDTNAFGKLVEAHGGVGMNAMTSWDATQYFYSMPSNKLELWCLLESDRFVNPVLREFYKEKNVILEERNMRTESQPQGRLFEEWVCAAYLGHPYGRPVIGHRTDIELWSRRDAEEFYKRHYGARNLVIAVVGDVYRADMERLAKKYFAQIPAGTDPQPVRTVEPEQLGERRVVIEESTQPFLFIGYHIPAKRHADRPAIGALASILGQGRASRLNERLVKADKLALFSGAFEGLPGDRYPALLTLIAVPNKDIPVEEVEAAVYAEAARIVAEGVTEAELAGYKTRARAEFIQGLDGNQGMAGQLCWAEMILGDWRELFKQLDAIDAVTSADVQRVAGEIFRTSNRTVGVIKTTVGS
jgi:predicted Zn-dependent peptidase